MSNPENPSAWERSVKTISDHSPVLNNDNLVKTWYAFLNAELDGFVYKIKVRFDPEEQKNPEDYNLVEIDQSLLQNTDTIAKNFKFKYDLYIARNS